MGTLYKNFKNDSVDIPQKLEDNLIQFCDENEALEVFLIREPLAKEVLPYSYLKGAVILIPGYKVLVVNFSNDNDDFEDFYEDFVEDLLVLSDKYSYNKKLGRPREWKKLIEKVNFPLKNDTFLDSLSEYKLIGIEKRKSELLISLLTGSINDISSLCVEDTDNILDKVKQKIVLFDGEQSRFIFEDIKKAQVRIQGLAGTGKTELLLHRLKELYTKNANSKIALTCFNKILANDLRERIPAFFDYMKVDEQIEWNKRLFVFSSWGSRADSNSGMYSKICDSYDIPFQQYSSINTFDKICDNALLELRKLKDIEPIFDYILIDESQDFSEAFFELCSMVTKENVYIAGDIFQEIFDKKTDNSEPDFLLNRVYRTDPRTFMFSQAIGLGLFERPVINWLEDNELESCGYKIKKDPTSTHYELNREKLRRFEDFEGIDNFKPVQITKIDATKTCDFIIETIKSIRQQNPTITPNDIGVVFLDNSNAVYKTIDTFESILKDELDWKINRGYENKVKIKDSDTLFVSNKNNIKGLEFPFVICVVLSAITKDVHSRNALYMAMTRSFITSYLLITSKNSDLIDTWETGLESIIKNNKLIIEKPSEDDIMPENTLKILQGSYKTQEQRLEEAISKTGTLTHKREISSVINPYLEKNTDATVEDIMEFIKSNRKFYKW